VNPTTVTSKLEGEEVKQDDEKKEMAITAEHKVDAAAETAVKQSKIAAEQAAAEKAEEARGTKMVVMQAHAHPPLFFSLIFIP
jgi:hypothetical protein